MSRTEFDHIGAVKEQLAGIAPFHVVSEKDGIAELETRPIYIGRMVVTFYITVNSEGYFHLRFFLGGRVSKRNIPAIHEACARALTAARNLKLVTDKSDLLTVIYDSLLPSDEKLIGEELQKTFGLINDAYLKMFPNILSQYWKDVSEETSKR